MREWPCLDLVDYCEVNYVQGAAKGDLPMLLSSGFNNINTNRAQSPLDKPTIQKIDNEMSTRLVLHLQLVANGRTYEVQVSRTARAGYQREHSRRRDGLS